MLFVMLFTYKEQTQVLQVSVCSSYANTLQLQTSSTCSNC